MAAMAVAGVYLVRALLKDGGVQTGKVVVY
jgi:hypothetical protein